MRSRVREPSFFSRFAGGKNPRPNYPKSLVETAYEQLLGMIVTMRIGPGEHIGIEALARDLQISQTPIREALTQLEAQKLATKIPNVGFKAAALLTLEETRHLFELRMLLEPKAAALAARRGDEAALQAIAEVSQEAGERTGGESGEVAYARFAEGDARLHQMIALASLNRFIAETIEGLHVHLHIFRFMFTTNAPQPASAEHAIVVEALLNRDARGAEQAMKSHLQASLERMEAAFDGPVAPVAAAPKARPRRRRTGGVPA